MIAFDAAANVQKGGKEIVANFPESLSFMEQSCMFSVSGKPKLNLLKTFTAIVSFLLLLLINLDQN